MLINLLFTFILYLTPNTIWAGDYSDYSCLNCENHYYKGKEGTYYDHSTYKILYKGKLYSERSFNKPGQCLRDRDLNIRCGIVNYDGMYSCSTCSKVTYGGGDRTYGLPRVTYYFYDVHYRGEYYDYYRYDTEGLCLQERDSDSRCRKK